MLRASRPSLSWISPAFYCRHSLKNITTNNQLLLSTKLIKFRQTTRIPSLICRQFSTKASEKKAKKVNAFNITFTEKKRAHERVFFVTTMFILVFMPISGAAIKGYDYRAWPVTLGEVEAIRTKGWKRRIRYKYRIWGKTFRNDQENFNIPIWDKINDTELDFAEGDTIYVKFHPQDPQKSLLKPGRFCLWDFRGDQRGIELVEEFDSKWNASKGRAG